MCLRSNDELTFVSGVVSLTLSLRVDRMYDQHLSWNDKLAENDSAEYQQLEFEAGKAVRIFSILTTREDANCAKLMRIFFTFFVFLD